MAPKRFRLGLSRPGGASMKEKKLKKKKKSTQPPFFSLLKDLLSNANHFYQSSSSLDYITFKMTIDYRGVSVIDPIARFE